MKKNKFTKIFLYTVISLVMAGVIFLALSYFGKGEETRKVDFSEKEMKKVIREKISRILKLKKQKR